MYESAAALLCDLLHCVLIDSDGNEHICSNTLENFFGQIGVYVALMKAIFVLHTYLRPPMVHLTRVQMHRWCTVHCYFDGPFQVLSFHPLFIYSLYLCAQILKCYKKALGESAFAFKHNCNSLQEGKRPLATKKIQIQIQIKQHSRKPDLALEKHSCIAEPILLLQPNAILIKQEAQLCAHKLLVN